MGKWLKVAKIAYCTEGDQWDCRNCEMCDYLKAHQFDSNACKEELIRRIIKEIEGELYGRLD